MTTIRWERVDNGLPPSTYVLNELSPCVPNGGEANRAQPAPQGPEFGTLLVTSKNLMQ